MLVWRSVIAVVSLGQIAAEVVCWYDAGDPDMGEPSRALPVG
jgi:hypothetical protein